MPPRATAPAGAAPGPVATDAEAVVGAIKPAPRLAKLFGLVSLVLLLAPVWPRVALAAVGADLLLLAAFVVEGRRLRRELRLRLRREAPPRFSIGVWNPVELQVESLTPFPLRLWLGDGHPRAFDLDPGSERIQLAPYGRGTASYQLRPHARGRYAFGDLEVEAEGPGGLAAVRARARLSAPVAVYPDLAGLRRLALGSRLSDLSLLGLRRLRREGTGDELDRLRDYQADDDFRDINWKATAKRSKPVTQVYETERSQRVLIALDCGRSMAARTGDLTKLDLAVNAALVLAHVALRVGDLVGLVVFASEVRAQVPPGRGGRHFARLVEALHAVREELVFVDYRALTREVAARRFRRGLVVVFTDLLDEASARPLVEAFRVLARKHAVLVVAPSDPVVLEAARARAERVEDVYRALAAREALAERRAVVESVRRLGVQVVDSKSGEMAVAGVNRYLEMKRRRAI